MGCGMLLHTIYGHPVRNRILDPADPNKIGPFSFINRIKIVLNGAGPERFNCYSFDAHIGNSMQQKVFGKNSFNFVNSNKM